MAKVWGLDLKEIRWSKFKSSDMWGKSYHLRRTKFIVYQLAMILCVVSECLGTTALSDYLDQQDYIQSHSLNASVYNDDYVGAASYNIFCGVFVATIFGAAFFFDLFWPERKESGGVKWAWKICAVLAAIFALSSALTLTVITAMHSAHVTGHQSPLAHELLEQYGGSPLMYRHNGRAIAAVVFIWPGWVATIASAVLLWVSQDHNSKHGPFSSRVRNRKQTAGWEDGSELENRNQDPSPTAAGPEVDGAASIKEARVSNGST